MSTLNDVIEVISEIIKKDRDFLLEHKEDTDLWDSFTKVEIVFALEEKFKVSFTPEQISDVKSIQTIVEIMSKV